jgi:hypothetical protein
LGRPIVLVKISSIQGFGMNLKDALLQEVERLRLHLRHLRDIHPNERFPLQYIVLVDLQGVSIQNNVGPNSRSIQLAPSKFREDSRIFFVAFHGCDAAISWNARSRLAHDYAKKDWRE